MKLFKIEDYGAIGDGRTDCTKAFYDIIADLKTIKGEKLIEFGTGEFLISDVLEVSGINDLTIQGKGTATILLQNGIKKGGIWVDNCNNIKISGFSFDMANLPYCQGIVRAFGECFVDIELAGEFTDKFNQPWFTENILNIASIVTGTGKENYYLQDFAWYKDAVPITVNLWRIHLVDDGWLDHCGIATGDGMYFLSRGGQKDVVYSAARCINLTMENLTAYSGCSLTMKLFSNENVNIRNLSVRKRNDRMISTNADGIHATDNRGDFEISGCFFEGMADDGINMHNHGHSILEVINDTKIKMPPGFAGKVGDSLQIIDLYNKHCVKGESKIIDCHQTDGGIIITLDSPIRQMASGKNVMRIKDSIILTVTGDQAYVPEACGRLHVHGCYFGRYRGRGILAHANAVIEDNIFDNNSAAAIQIMMDSVWPEGPVPENIVIKNNKFLAGTSFPGQPAIIASWIAQDKSLKNIAIERNDFSGDFFTSAIVIENGNNIRISGNAFPDNIDRKNKISFRGICDDVVSDITEDGDVYVP